VSEGEGSAEISECGKYRYVLRRSLGSILRWYKPCLFVMLNLSTADAELDDPTIRRCISFAKREGKTHLNVVNLFALRATNPKELHASDDPVGSENDKHLFREIQVHSLAIGAWGSHPIASSRVEELVKNNILPRNMYCLGKTKTGSPRHPLYVKSDVVLTRLTLQSKGKGGKNDKT